MNSDTKKINISIQEFETKAYRDIDEKYALDYFQNILYYNKGFVDFLVEFYDLVGKRILDYGCGLGMFAKLFSKYSRNISACDVSKDEIEFAKANTSKEIHYFIDDFFNCSLHPNSFDFIFCRNLGPLQKIDFSDENSKLLVPIISSLSQNGIGFFILMGNLSGKPKHRTEGSQNHRIEIIYKFFRQAGGYISMINVLGNQAVVITKTETMAAFLNQKMYLAVKYLFQNLRLEDESGYVICKSWLYLNRPRDEDFFRRDFKKLNLILRQEFYPFLKRGLISFSSYPQIKECEYILKCLPLYWVGGDSDKNFEKSINLRILKHHFPMEVYFSVLRLLRSFKNKIIKSAR